MKILKGSLLKVTHSRKGNFKGIAVEDFDTDVSEFYPIALADDYVTGLSNDWTYSETIPCRRSLCKIELINCEE